MCPSVVGLLAAAAACLQGTPVQDSITDVWGSCFTDVKKCDFGLAISGHGLTCSGLNCVFEESCECGAAVWILLLPVRRVDTAAAAAAAALAAAGS